MAERKTGFEFSPSNDEAAIKDFPNVLKKTLLNVPYTIQELEFEFDLKWETLEAMLKEHTNYETHDDKVILTAKINIKEPELITPEEFEQIVSLFYTGKDPFLYKSLKPNSVKPKNQPLLEKAIKSGIVLYQKEKMILVLNEYLRKTRKNFK